MEVRKLVLVVSLLALAACDKPKTEEDVAAYKKTDSLLCDQAKFLKNRFVVKYEDGRIEVIEAENEAIFEDQFLRPRLSEIKRVEYDSLVTLDTGKPDLQPTAAGDYGPTRIKADVAWNQGIYGQGVTVAVIDTAVEFSHSALSSRLAYNLAEKNGLVGVDDDGNGYTDDEFGWDFIEDAPPSAIVSSDVEHGTHVAGIVLADPTQSTMTGVAPQAKLIPASFIDPKNGSISAAIRAIQYSASRGAKIINASWGGGNCSETLKETIAEVGQKGVLFVAASGNEGLDFDRHGIYSYPAVYNLANQITVAATDIFNHLTPFSNRSYTFVHIGAPGDQIRSAVPYATSSERYALLSGTSMAAPMVSGAAALLWSAKPNATAAQIKQAILSSTDFNSYKVSTQGLLNVEKALTEIRRIVP